MDIRQEFDNICAELELKYQLADRKEYELKVLSNNIMMLEIDKRILSKQIKEKLNEHQSISA